MIYLGRDQVGLNQLVGSGAGSTLTSLVFDLDPMTNASGSYTHTTSIQGVTDTMKPIMIEYSNPSAFLDQVTVTCNNGSITLSCPNVSGSSNISVTVTDISSDSQTTFSGVEDVQVNGTSIVNNGIANIPLVQNSASASPGLVRVNWGGLQVDSNGFLKVNPATSEEIKTATASYVTIAPGKQHESTFYGLATAAGDTSQKLSINNVGEYTPEAKIAIQKMLGLYEAPWELIKEDTFTNEVEADHIITTDANNNPLDLTDVIMLFELPKQSVEASKMTWGQIWYHYTKQDGSTTYLAPEAGQWTQAADSAAHGFTNFIYKQGDLIIYSDAAQTTTSNSGNNRYRYGQGLRGASEAVQMIPNFSVFKITIKTVKGTGHYILYGKRRVT